jgi:hypothetical protein
MVTDGFEATGVSLLLSFALIRVHPRASVVLFILLDGLVFKAPAEESEVRRSYVFAKLCRDKETRRYTRGMDLPLR